MYAYICICIQLDSAPQIPTMNTFSTQGNCSVTVSDLDLLRILFHGDSISREYEARYPFNQKLGIIYTLHRGRQFSYSRLKHNITQVNFTQNINPSKSLE